jgi:hypothetical protein
MRSEKWRTYDAYLDVYDLAPLGWAPLAGANRSSLLTPQAVLLSISTSWRENYAAWTKALQ